MNSRVLIFFATLALIVSTTTLIFLWAKGYTINRETRKVERVGMISVKSLPDGARIFLDNTLTLATNTTLGNLKGGTHKLRIEKEGFSSWEKDVLVKEELVTFVDVILVPRSVEIKPLTTSGVALPILNNSKDKIYFLAETSPELDIAQKSGIWSLDLNSSIFNIFKTGATLVFTDKRGLAYSSAEALLLSPSDNQMLIKMNEKGYYLADLGNGDAPAATATAVPALETWGKEILNKRRLLSDKYNLAGDLKEIATDPQTLWSPDEKKFLFRRKNEKGDSWRYFVHNLTDPLGVGEADEYLVSTVSLDSEMKFTWYPDSKHLLSSECETQPKANQPPGATCASGSIHLLEIDGTNNTQVYSGSMASDSLFPTPDGSKIIILATFNQTAPPNLYAISLR